MKKGRFLIGDNIGEIVPSLEVGNDINIKTLEKYKLLDANICISGHNNILGKEVFEVIEKSLI